MEFIINISQPDYAAEQYNDGCRIINANSAKEAIQQVKDEYDKAWDYKPYPGACVKLPSDAIMIKSIQVSSTS